MNNFNKKTKKSKAIAFKNKYSKMNRFVDEVYFDKRGINEDFLEDEIKLFNKCKEFAQDYIDLYDEYRRLIKLYKKKKDEINELNKELEKYSKFKKERLVKDEDVINVKKLKSQGATYRNIEKTTGWSKYTIGKILNGYYD